MLATAIAALAIGPFWNMVNKPLTMLLAARYQAGNGWTLHPAGSRQLGLAGPAEAASISSNF
jgi:hypothetical protein